MAENPRGSPPGASPVRYGIACLLAAGLLLLVMPWLGPTLGVAIAVPVIAVLGIGVAVSGLLGVATGIRRGVPLAIGTSAAGLILGGAILLWFVSALTRF